MFPQANSPSATAQTRKVSGINDNHQQIASATTSMKRLLFLAISAFSITAYALPTYDNHQQIASATTSMKRLLFLAISAFSIPAYALPPYEPRWRGRGVFS